MDSGSPATVEMYFMTIGEADVPHVAGASDATTLLGSSDCSICHSADVRTVGPSWIEIARRYDRSDETIDELASKIVEGGSVFGVKLP